jgi:hypothetical protein
MRCTAAASPAAHTRKEVRPADGGDERIARSRTRRHVVPLDGRVWSVGQREPGVGVGDLDVPVGRQGLEQLADGRDRGLATGQQERAGLAVDGVARDWQARPKTR